MTALLSASCSATEMLRRDVGLVQIVDAAFADSAARSGRHLICRPGCTQCCHGAFEVNELDAMRLRAGMATLALEQPEIAAAIEARARAYLAEFGSSFPGDLATGILGTSKDDELAFEGYANDAACPVLNPETGMCDLYSARPMTCRVFGPPVRSGSEDGLAVCELCFTTATEEEIVAAEMRVPSAEEETLLEALRAAESKDLERLPETTIVAVCLLPAVG